MRFELSLVYWHHETERQQYILSKQDVYILGDPRDIRGVAPNVETRGRRQV